MFLLASWARTEAERGPIGISMSVTNEDQRPLKVPVPAQKARRARAGLRTDVDDARSLMLSRSAILSR
jgi:hypothetical protein